MTCEAITIVRGNDTNFNGANFLTINLDTEILDLSTFKAVFTLGSVVKTFNDISTGTIVINLSAAETKNLPAFINGILQLIDETNKIATIESLIPFKIISNVHGNAIATEPYTLNFDVKQGGETILTVNVESAVTVEVGTTTTLPAGSEATVTNVGTNNHLILDFGIPQGNGIESIIKTSTSGLVDTYTITYENGDTDTIEVTNGNGIKSVAKTSTSGLVDTYTITFDNNDTETFTVTNGSSIASIEKTSTSGLVDTYTITLTNGNTSTFTVTNGKDGKDGVDGVSPTASVTPTSSGATITITDAQGTTTANITNGQDGADGTDGTNATITGATASVSNTVGIPNVVVTSGGTESARSFNFAFTNLKGEKGDTGAGMVAEVVQTLPTTGETGKLYLVPKDTPEQEDIYDEWIWAIVTSPDTYGWEHIGSTDIDLSDYIKGVQINGTDLTPDENNKVNIPKAASNTLGTIMIGSGLAIQQSGSVYVVAATESNLINKLNASNPVVSTNLNIAVREGLGNNTLTWSDAYKTSACKTIGTISGVQINGTDLTPDTTTNKVNIPVASSDYGVVKTNASYGIEITSAGFLGTISANTTVIDAKLNGRQVITPNNLDYAVKVGVTTNTQNLTATEKGNACDWIGAIKDVQVNGTSVVTSGVGNIPKANNDGTVVGVVQLSNTYGSQTVNGYLAAVDRSYAGFVGAQSTSIASVGGVKAYVGGMSVAYNASQSLTDAQKEQARTNIGAEAQSTIQALSATDSITLADNTIYNGGEQTALTITLPSTVDVSFLCEIDFTSSTSPTTLTYSNTIKWAGDDVNNNVFLPVASKRYTIICAYDGVNYRFTVKGVE